MTKPPEETHPKDSAPQLEYPLDPDAFKLALRDLNLTRTRFAEALAVDRRTVQKWASGESPVPRYAVIILRLIMRFELQIEDIEQA